MRTSTTSPTFTILLAFSGVLGAFLPELGQLDSLLSAAAEIVMKGVA